MARELSNASLKDNREGRLQASESHSSTYANPPFSPDYSRDGSPAPSDSRATGQLTTDISNLSLSVNYLPSKFSSSILVGGGETRRRPVMHDDVDFIGSSALKMGGGIDAFKSGEARMGGEGDDDDASTKKWFVRGRKGDPQGLNKKLRWNKFKWILFSANVVVSFLVVLSTHVHRWFAVDGLRVHHTYILSPDLVRRLGSSRHHPRW